jgi:hypothetical protein
LDEAERTIAGGDGCGAAGAAGTTVGTAGRRASGPAGAGRPAAVGRGTGVRVEAERLDVVYADAQAWWAEQWAHGERRPLERMGRRALAAYRAAAFAAIEACREADGGCIGERR